MPQHTQVDDPNKPNPFLAHKIKGAQSSSINPFMQHNGAPTAQPELAIGDQIQQATSRTDISALESLDVAQNKAQLEEMLKRTDLTPGHRARLEQMVKRLTVPSVGGIELTNRVTEPDRSDILSSGVQPSNLARGVTAGAVNYGVLGAIDLGAAAAQIALPKSLERLLPLAEFRKSLHETQTIIREELDPQGWWGTGGTATGALAGGLKPFMVMNNVGLQALLKLPKSFGGKLVAGVVYRGTQAGASFLERFAANALGSGAVDAVQLVDILSETEVSDQQKAITLAAVVGMSLGSAGVQSLMPIPAGARPRVADPNVPSKAAEPPIGEVKPSRGAEAESMVGKAATATAAAERRLKINSLARKTWEIENPGKLWKNDLSKAAQKEWMDSFRARFSDPNLDTSTADQLGLPLKPSEDVPAAPEALGKLPAEGEKGIPTGGGVKAPRVEDELPPIIDKQGNPIVSDEDLTGLVKEDAPLSPIEQLRKNLSRPLDPEFEGDQRLLPRGPSAAARLDLWLELEAINPTKFSIDKAKGLYDKLTPNDRFTVFGHTDEWSNLSIAQRLTAFKQMSKQVDVFKSARAEKAVDAQLTRGQRIDLGEKMIADGRTTGDFTQIQRGEELLARMEVLPDDVDKNAVFTRIVDDLTQEMPREMKTEVMLAIFRGEMPRHSVFAGEKGVAFLLRMGASYDPRFTAKPGLTKPEPATTSPSESVSADTQVPAPDTEPPPRAEGAPSGDQVAELRAELERTKLARDEAVRSADVDPVTGHGNKAAFLRALPSAEAEANTEITYFDVTNFKPYNDTFGDVAGDAELVRFAGAIEAAMRSMGMVRNAPDATVRLFRQGDEFFVIHERGRGGELIKAAKDIAGVKETIVGDATYQRGLRGASGNNFERASLAIKKVKQGETFAKARDTRAEKPAAETMFHGQKIKRPLSEMGINEIEHVQSMFDTLHDKGEISLNEWNDISAELTAADHARNAVELPYRQQWDLMSGDARVKLAGTKAGQRKWDTLSDAARNKVMEKLDVRTKTSTTAEAVDLEAEARSTTTLPSDPGAPARVVAKSKLKGEIVDPAIQLARAEKQRWLFKQPVEKLTDADLLTHRNDLDDRVRVLGTQEAQSSGYSERLAKLNEELARRSKIDKSGSGGVLYTHPAVTGFVAGWAAGMVAPADEDQDRWSRALYWGLAGGAAATYLGRMKKASQAAVPEYQKNIRTKVKSVEDAPLDRRQGIFSYLMKAYGNVARRDIGISNVSKLVDTKSLPAGQSAGKRAEIFGLWRGMTDQWLIGDKIGYWTNEGEFVQLDAKPLTQIAQMVKGDLRTVGDLAAAKRELTLRGLEHPRTTGLDIEDARQMYTKTPEIYHQAVEELGKFFRAMRDMSVAAGLLTKEAAAKMDEQGFYVAIRRLFDNQPGTAPGKIDVKSGGGSRGVGPEDLFRYLKGSKLPFQNPVEAAIDLLPRYMRAAELNRLAVTFFDEVMQLNPKDRRLIARRLEGPDIPKSSDATQAKVTRLKKTISDEGGSTISDNEAEAILTSLSDESLNITNDVIRFYRDGKLEVWRVSDPVARSFRAMQPHDLAAMLEGLGLLTKPTNIARVGITANPVFVGWQAFRDIWQFHQNGAYAPSPDAPLASRLAGAVTSLPKSLAGSVHGWLEIMFRTGEYKRYLSAGAGGESVASQGLKVVRGNIKESTDLLTKVSERPARNQFEQIAREIKQMSFREAYASLLQPVADAGRFGAYLRERGRGADVIEAIFRSKKVGANFGNRGASTAIQAANRMTLFLNPAIQGMDASRYSFMRDPVGYVVRGIVGTSAISAALWAAYEDDEEIKQLRSTPYGSKFWWIRVFGHIVKLPKPIFEGQIFGTTVEAWLDHKKGQDPLAYRKWVEAMWNDATVNLLPFIGVVPISLATGKIVGLGSDVVPPGTEHLDVEYRARPNSSTLARLASQATGGLARKLDTRFTDNMLSPAGYDFIVSQYLGGLGSELSRGLSIAIDAQRTGGDLPPKEELPFIRSVFGQYPSLGVQAINEFYTYANRADIASSTVNYLATANPEKLVTYMQNRMQDIMLANTYAQTRGRLTDLRRAIEDIRQAPRDVMSDKDKRELTQVLLRQIIDLARITNENTRLIRNSIAIAAEK